MKKLDKFVIKAMLPPYVLAFFVAEFVLVMQFLWKYIDEIIGKGISIWVLFELIFYFAVTIIPMAIPLTVLISAVMVYGNMGERYELSSIKSAGISLFRIMRPALWIASLTALFSLVSANYLKPKANLKFYQRLHAVQKQKASLAIEEKIFNDDFKNIIMRVEEKNNDGPEVKDVLIYDHTSINKEDVNFIKAAEGEMYASDNGKYFVMQLEDGVQYMDLKENKSKKSKGSYRPFMRTHFKEYTKIFDMSQFEMEASRLNMARKSYDLMNCFQLADAIDSLAAQRDTNLTLIQNHWNGANENKQKASSKTQLKGKKGKKTEPVIPDIKRNKKPKTLNVKGYMQDTIVNDSTLSLIDLFPSRNHKNILSSSIGVLSKHADYVFNIKGKNESLIVKEKKHTIRLHQMFSWAFVCIIFLFIGAPLGSIIRKGGYGYPLLFAIIFFMLFVVLNIMGEKLSKSNTIDPILAAWLPCIFLLPFAIYLTIKAVKDEPLSVSFNIRQNPVFRWFNLRLSKQ